MNIKRTWTINGEDYVNNLESENIAMVDANRNFLDKRERRVGCWFPNGKNNFKWEVGNYFD